MDIYPTFQIIITMILLFGVLAAIFFATFWFKDRRKQAKMESEEMYRNRKLQKEQLRQTMKFREQESSGSGSGGFIILNLPQDQISVFHDLLKGFEDYAKVKGYEIRFSADTTYNNKIAFKFTLGDEGINVSTQKVKKDLQEYIHKIQSGDTLNDLPVILPEAEHNLLLTLMKNRINFFTT